MGALRENSMSECPEENNNLDKKIEQLKKGDIVKTPSGIIYDVKEPPWLDKEKFYKAGKIYRTYFGGINFSHFCGLLLSFYFSKNIDTLKSTGWSANSKKLFERYVSTVRHVQSWYEGDVWDLNHPSRKSLFIVREMHSRVANKMSNMKQDGIVYVSQWDMAITQWAFIGLFVLHPNKFGLQTCSVDDIDCLIHFWRGVGYLLGIDDKYNLCNGSYDDVVKTCNLMLLEYRENVIVRDSSSEEMGKSVVTAFSKLDSIFTWGFLVNFIHELVNVPCSVEMSIHDWICYRVMKFILEVVDSYTFPRFLMNELLRWKIERADNLVGTFEKLKINMKGHKHL